MEPIWGWTPETWAEDLAATLGLTRVSPRWCATPSALLQQARDRGVGRILCDGDVVAELGDGPDESVPGALLFDLDDPWGAAQARDMLRLRVLERLVRAGVLVDAPSSCAVDATVTVAAGARLGLGVVLRGTTSVAAGAELMAGVHLTDTQVGEGAVVKPHTVAEGAVIGADSAVGPAAHLRTGAVLERGVKVGNYVEVKKAVLHAGAKASHLSYIGDAEVGEAANIGAGTITCNYDGYGKHRTIIGAGAFVGSNTALVAPVRIGAGSIIGAGSTVTQDVPDDALAVERAPQRILEGRAPRLRKANARRAGKTP